MKLIYATLLLFLFQLPANSQRDKIWFFGLGAGLNFGTTPPSVVSGGNVYIPDNSSTISDASGNLLFYTDGVTVWDKQHGVMPNGSGLTGHSSAGQCALIVPQPCNPNKYVIFHTTEFSSPGYLHYTMVDMTLNNGAGDVVTMQKNISLGTGWTEKLCAIYNPSQNSYWVLAHKWNSDQFVSFQVSSSAIAAVSVTSSIGSIHNCGSYGGAHDAMGQLTISRDGSKVVNALTCQDKYELFDFDLLTGSLSGFISIPGNGGNAWGTAFSPDSKKLFTNSIFGQSIFQYDLNSNNQQTIISSMYTVATVSSTGYNFGYMELGPDNKLYIGRPSTNFLSVINNPNVMGSGNNFVLSGQGLGSDYSSHGISRIAYNIPPGAAGVPAIFSNPSTAAICSGASATLSVTGPGTYTWNGTVVSPTIAVNPSVTTTYTVSGNACSMGTISISVHANPTISIAGNEKICRGKSATLTATGAGQYAWNTGINGPVISVSPLATTIYSVVGTSANSCTSIGIYTVSVNECVGVQEQNDTDLFFIMYPNPVNELLTIEQDKFNTIAGNSRCSIINSTGVKIFETGEFKNRFVLDTRMMEKGVYFLLIETETIRKAYKLIKE